ncbi:hypothetical protein [Streptomyces sp. DH37]|uniref:hypothetical protein n=1 Tax=Streptomyces sp. DH37 TaxID=3040122 RepID=UPI002441B31F|nr:hypothetical protein [Streptomyces sp. DH37]MDG9700965.1 hypothetical protein [Streptomyces sp. DH37]
MNRRHIRWGAGAGAVALVLAAAGSARADGTAGPRLPALASPLSSAPPSVPGVEIRTDGGTEVRLTDGDSSVTVVGRPDCPSLSVVITAGGDPGMRLEALLGCPCPPAPPPPPAPTPTPTPPQPTPPPPPTSAPPRPSTPPPPPVRPPVEPRPTAAAPSPTAAPAAVPPSPGPEPGSGPRRPVPPRGSPPPERASPAPSASPVPAAPRAEVRRHRPDAGLPLVGRALLIVAPAVLAAAALRPRSGSRSR